MAGSERKYVDDVPEDVEDRLRAICATLPEVYEERAWVGIRWRIRKRSFAHVLGVVNPDGTSTLVLVFRSSGAELEVLRQVGHPFFELGWGNSAIGMVIDEETDWDEVAELLTDSYCVLAPKKLAAQIDRPPESG